MMADTVLGAADHPCPDGGQRVNCMAVAGHAYDEQLVAKETAHQTKFTLLANASPTRVLAEQGKFLTLEQSLAASDRSYCRTLTDAKTKQSRLGDRLLLPTCGFKSSSTELRMVVTQCNLPPVPAAWLMVPLEPNLFQRMSNELSESTATAIRD
ncbi:hypothetical protein ACIGCH_17725 [Pseudomonas helleri]|uniref:hypothetical protein n=1 Tax=Pseudomonas helleri TaxID=1608996 RepID=UPI0037CCB326